jgi:hypothetical protein
MNFSLKINATNPHQVDTNDGRIYATFINSAHAKAFVDYVATAIGNIEDENTDYLEENLVDFLADLK